MELINDPESNQLLHIFNFKVSLNLISIKLAGDNEDKMRLFMIYYLCSNNLSQAELDQYLIQLKEANCDIDAIKFLKRYKSISKMSYGNQTTDNQYSAVK